MWCYAESTNWSGARCKYVSKLAMDCRKNTGFTHLPRLPGSWLTFADTYLKQVGDIFFSEDETSLLVMVKGGMDPTFAGFVAKFAVQDGTVATTATVTTPPSSGALFGAGLIPGSPNMILESDASVGALILNIDDLAATTAVVNITGQKASCWARVSTVTGTGFITDVLVNRLVEVDVHSGAIVTEYYAPTPFTGMSDFSTVGNFLWSLSAGNGTFPASITTFDIGGGPGTVREVSTYAIPGAGVNTMGMTTM